MTTKRLLLIDDDEDTRILVKLVLESQENWEVLTASSGTEGIIQVKTELPDVVLLDLRMNDLDGLAILKHLKSNLFTCSIPIIFFTAMVTDKVISQLKHTLSEGIITKPCDIVNLAYQIAAICQWDIS